MAPQLSGKSFKAVSRSKASVSAGKPLPSKKEISGAFQKQKQGFQGPVAGYTGNEKEKTTTEIINEYTKGEKYSTNTKNTQNEHKAIGERNPHTHQMQSAHEVTVRQIESIEDPEEKESATRRIERIYEEQLSTSPPIVLAAKPVGGIGYYATFFIVMAKDLIDILWEVMSLFADITVILGIITWCISTVMDIMVFLITSFYFWYVDLHGGSVRAKAQTISMFTEILPIGGFVPAQSMAYWWIVHQENKRRKREKEELQQQKNIEHQERIQYAINAQQELREMSMQNTHVTQSHQDTQNTPPSVRAGNKIPQHTFQSTFAPQPHTPEQKKTATIQQEQQRRIPPAQVIQASQKP